MPCRLPLFFGALLGLWLLPVTPARSEEFQRPTLAAKDIESMLRTDWYGLYLKGKKIGYVRIAREPAGDFIRETELFSMKLSSFGKKSEIYINQSLLFEKKAPYRLMRAEKNQRNDP